MTKRRKVIGWSLAGVLGIALAAECGSGTQNPEGSKCTEIGARKTVVQGDKRTVYECKYLDPRNQREGLVWRKVSG